VAARSERRLLAGKRVLITGAARRIGREIAIELARAGADVAITYLTSAAEAKRALAELKTITDRAFAIRCDVRDEQTINAAVKEAVHQLGGLDLLINNAAVYETVPIQKITIQQWDEMFNTNTRGPFLMSRACWPHLKKSRGKIINVGSLGGVRPWTTHAHYCQSKAALHMQTQLLAKEFAPEVAVNCVAPGMIDLKEHRTSDFLKHIGKKTPMQRNGSARDVAAAVLLMAQMPHFVTGQIVDVDGGLNLV
jgi:3-oxoacyl-[acyl-carrier protein] reductase/pteridine reductase